MKLLRGNPYFAPGIKNAVAVKHGFYGCFCIRGLFIGVEFEVQTAHFEIGRTVSGKVVGGGIAENQNGGSGLSSSAKWS